LGWNVSDWTKMKPIDFSVYSTHLDDFSRATYIPFHRADPLVKRNHRGKLLKLAAVVHFLGWYIQIHPGHGIYEGAKPAVMQSIGGALTSAPLFAYYEGLWFIGLNKGLQDQTKALVDQYSIDLCKNGLNMRACADYDLN
jgi:uncharacterized membrane protein YGL010W